MNYGELKTYVRSLINRTDLTDALAVQFIQQSQDRLERLARPSFLQRFVSFTLDGTSGDFRLPTDFLELIDLYTDNGPLNRVDVAQWLKVYSGAGCPQVFLQTGHDMRMRPIPDATTTLYLHYYGLEPELVTDVDENYWTRATVDALTYGAVALAADYYEDERLQGFEAKFQNSLQEIQDQQLTEDFSGRLSIAPAYCYPED
jgi:hypothetical protein